MALALAYFIGVRGTQCRQQRQPSPVKVTRGSMDTRFDPTTECPEMWLIFITRLPKKDEDPQTEWAASRVKLKQGCPPGLAVGNARPLLGRKRVVHSCEAPGGQPVFCATSRRGAGVWRHAQRGGARPPHGS